MHVIHERILRTRREFLTTTASGLGMMALGSLLTADGFLTPASAAPATPAANPLAPRSPHFAPRAKNCILIYMEGAPSQMDLFDPKPRLNELHGRPMPESLTKNVRFAFLKKETARLMGSKRTFKKYGRCGMDF